MPRLFYARLLSLTTLWVMAALAVAGSLVWQAYAQIHSSRQVSVNACTDISLAQAENHDSALFVNCGGFLE